MFHDGAPDRKLLPPVAPHTLVNALPNESDGRPPHEHEQASDWAVGEVNVFPLGVVFEGEVVYGDAGEVWEEEARDGATFFDLCWGAVVVATDDAWGGDAVELASSGQEGVQEIIFDCKQIMQNVRQFEYKFKYFIE